MARIPVQMCVAVAAFWFVMTAGHATPLEECLTADVPVACLDAKLKEANLRLNATLKAAQGRIEQLQQDGRRSVIGAFVDSQRKFNAYRDAQCAWQAIHAAPGSNPAEYVKDCQIRATIARERLCTSGSMLYPKLRVESRPSSLTGFRALPAVLLALLVVGAISATSKGDFHVPREQDEGIG